MAKPENIKKLNDQLARFSNFSKETLIHRPEWGEISFKDASSDLDRIFDIINFFKVLPFNILPDDSLNLIINSVTAINNHFDTINNFSITKDNPAQIRDQYIAQTVTHADNLYKNATPWIPFLAYQQGDVAQNIKSLTQAVKDTEKLINDTKTTIEIKAKEIQDIINTAREASAGAGAAVFTQDFSNESINLKTNATSWLRVTGILAIGTVLIALGMWLFAEGNLDTGQLWQKFGTKVAVIAILFSATLWCAKIYKALMHQSSINRHRALSIQTIQAFVASVADVQMKDAVVLEATKSIFGNVTTGYIESTNSSDGDLKILEVARNAMSKR